MSQTQALWYNYQLMQVEAATFVYNPYATNADNQSAADIQTMLHRRPDIYLSSTITVDRNYPQAVIKQIQKETDAAITRDGRTAFVIYSGDGTLQKTWQTICRTAQESPLIREKIRLVFVPGGDWTVHKDIYGTSPSSQAVASVLTDGSTLPVDHERILLKDVSENETVGYALISFGCLFASHMLSEIERARRRTDKKMSRREKSLHGIRGLTHDVISETTIIGQSGIVYQQKKNTFLLEVPNGSMLHRRVTQGTIFDGELTVIAVPADNKVSGILKTYFGLKLARMGFRDNRNPLFQTNKDTGFTVEFDRPVNYHTEGEPGEQTIKSAVVHCIPGAVPFLVDKNKTADAA